MECIGDEKRIRAQFHNLAIQDKSALPDFEDLWTRADSANLAAARWTTSLQKFLVTSSGLLIPSTAERRTSPKLFEGHFSKFSVASFVLITALLITVFCFRQSAVPSVEMTQAIAAASTESSSAVPRAVEQKVETRAPRGSRRMSPRRSAISRRAMVTPVKKNLEEVVSLSSWKSPTEVFLQSPVTPAFNSLPALNQAAQELASYLSTNESKELK